MRPERREVLDDHPVVAVGELARRHALGVGLHEDRRAVLVGAADHEDVVPAHPHVAAEDVGGHAETGDVADVARAVGVRPGDGGQDVGHGPSLVRGRHRLSRRRPSRSVDAHATLRRSSSGRRASCARPRRSSIDRGGRASTTTSASAQVTLQVALPRCVAQPRHCPPAWPTHRVAVVGDAGEVDGHRAPGAQVGGQDVEDGQRPRGVGRHAPAVGHPGAQSRDVDGMSRRGVAPCAARGPAAPPAARRRAPRARSADVRPRIAVTAPAVAAATTSAAGTVSSSP